MGSVIDAQKCEKCGHMAILDFNYKTLEEYLICKYCGKGYNYYIKRNKDGSPELDDEGNPIRILEENEGYGVAKLTSKNGVSVIYALQENYDLEEIIKEIETNEEINKELSYVTKWDTQRNKLVVVYGEIPPYDLYEEEDEENNLCYDCCKDCEGCEKIPR